MARDDTVAVVESFFRCLVSKDLDRIPVHPNLSVESPSFSKRSGPEAMEAIQLVAAAVKDIRVIQHIVEGDCVATEFEEETVNGPLAVFTRFLIESGLIKDIRVFYDSRQLTSSK